MPKGQSSQFPGSALMRGAVIFLIRCYRFAVSPLVGPCCRFYPSCSAYAEEAVRTRGILEGIFLTIRRLLKCQPFHPGGIDVLETRT